MLMGRTPDAKRVLMEKIMVDPNKSISTRSFRARPTEANQVLIIVYCCFIVLFGPKV